MTHRRETSPLRTRLTRMRTLAHTPREVDAQFQSLVRPTLDSLVGTVTL